MQQKQNNETEHFVSKMVVTNDKTLVTFFFGIHCYSE